MRPRRSPAGRPPVTRVAARRRSALPLRLPDLVIVNPPRRGLGEALATGLGSSGIPTVVYSSCNATTLARDLELMPAYRVREARLFDMFPQSTHAEVMVLLERR